MRILELPGPDARLLVDAAGCRIDPDGVPVADLLAPWGLQGTYPMTVIDKVRGAEDQRCVLHVVDGAEHWGVRIGRNAFTTDARLAEIAVLQDHYERRGVHCSHVLRSMAGEYLVDVGGLPVFCETWIDGGDAWDHPDDQRTAWLVAKEAEIIADPAPAMSTWTSYNFIDRFVQVDEFVDDADTIADHIKTAFAESLPGDARVAAFLTDWHARKAAFATQYQDLPSAPVQADLNGSFKGLIDFNLAGNERRLNYLTLESLVGIDSVANILDPASQ